MAPVLTLPLDKFIDAIHGSVSRVVNRIEIYTDADVLWKSSENVIHDAGTISVDRTRAERRTLNGLSITGPTAPLVYHPTEFWYDKIIKPYRGVYAADGTYWERKLGEFMVDTINDDERGMLIVNGRDFTKKLMLSKFSVPTGFAINSQVETVIQTIATNGGITKFDLDVTNKTLAADYIFDSNTTRWDAIAKLAGDYGFDCYFDSDGYLKLEAFSDPYLDSAQYTFETGVDSNLGKINKSTNDSQIFNHIVVTGDTTGVTLPVVAEAENTEATSPTRIAKIGRRTFFHQSALITDQTQAQTVANNLLSIRALETFDANVEAIVAPYLEPGIVVQFNDPNAAPGDPVKYLLSSFTIPLTLGIMPVNIRRVTKVRA